MTSIAFSFAVKERCDSGVGMIVLESSDKILATNSLLLEDFGTIANFPGLSGSSAYENSELCNCNPADIFPLSGP